MKKYIIFAFSIFLIICACDNDPSSSTDDQPQSEDREKFIGNWAGTYECASSPADTMIIWLGSGLLDFSIAIHAQVWIADTIYGELTKDNQITAPEQTMGGFPGTARITYSDGKLSFSQTGLGITCNGSNYTKF